MIWIGLLLPSQALAKKLAELVCAGAISLSVYQTVLFGFSDFQLQERWGSAHVSIFFHTMHFSNLLLWDLLVYEESPNSAHFITDAAAQGLQPDQIIFTDVAMKQEHIKRSSLADLFLDT